MLSFVLQDLMLKLFLNAIFGLPFGILFVFVIYKFIKSHNARRGDVSERTVATDPDAAYSRRVFGTAWKDMDRNGRDTRNDILDRDLINKHVAPGGKVLSGTLLDPYSGQTEDFSASNPTSVHIDHIFPMSQAFARGANLWDQDMREQFANDPENLIAVSAQANMSKSDKTLSSWVPANTLFHAQYAQMFMDIAIKYSIPVTEREIEIATAFTGTDYNAVFSDTVAA